jgi:glucosamine--fructose-6-phosphate aminotransferase (isomerizing)
LPSRPWTEIEATGEALSGTLKRLEALPPWPPGPVLLVGCGSSRHLARIAEHIARAAGRPIRAVAGSALWRRPAEALCGLHSPLVVGISRSGETTEVLEALRVARAHDLPTFALTGRPGSALGAEAGTRLELAEVRERGIVMTHAFGAMLLAAVWLAGADPAATREAVSAAQACWRRSLELAATVQDARRFVFLGTGAFAPLADEAQLKLQETAQAEAYAFDAWEFRHGPIAIADPSTAVAWLGGERADAAILGDVEALGGRTLSLPDQLGAGGLAGILAAAPFAQALACLLAASAGMDPDHPSHLHRVVRVQP